MTGRFRIIAALLTAVLTSAFFAPLIGSLDEARADDTVKMVEMVQPAAAVTLSCLPAPPSVCVLDKTVLAAHPNVSRVTERVAFWLANSPHPTGFAPDALRGPPRA